MGPIVAGQLGHWETVDLLDAARALAGELAVRLADPALMDAMPRFPDPARRHPADDWALYADDVTEDELAGLSIDDVDAQAPAEEPSPRGTFPELQTGAEELSRVVEASRTSLAGHVGRIFDAHFTRQDVLGIPEGKCAYRNAIEYLRERLRIPRRQARILLERAEHLATTRTLDRTHHRPPRLPVLARTLTAGELDPAAVDAIITTLTGARERATEVALRTRRAQWAQGRPAGDGTAGPGGADGEASGSEGPSGWDGGAAGGAAGVDPDLVERFLVDGERLLVSSARDMDPDALAKACAHWRAQFEATVDPDGIEPSEARRRAHQGLFYRGRKDGMHRWTLLAAQNQHEILKTITTAASSVRAHHGHHAPAGLPDIPVIPIGQSVPPAPDTTFASGTRTSTEEDVPAEDAAPVDGRVPDDEPARSATEVTTGSHATAAAATIMGTGVAGTQNTRPGTAGSGPVASDEPPSNDAASTPSDVPQGGGPPEWDAQAVDADALDDRSRAQRELDGLISALTGALALTTTAEQPDGSGGARPQVLVTIDYQSLLEHAFRPTSELPRELRQRSKACPEPCCDSSLEATPWTVDGPSPVDDMGLPPWPPSPPPPSSSQPPLPLHLDQATVPRGERISSAAFTGPISPATIRAWACDAELIPVVLGGDGEVLDAGRARRLFTRRQRRALTARDGGCAAPGCTIPAPWCEAHHIDHWEHGGTTSVDNGVLLCSHHHHAVHARAWTISMRNGIPWFIPAAYHDLDQRPRRNHTWRPRRAV